MSDADLYAGRDDILNDDYSAEDISYFNIHYIYNKVRNYIDNDDYNYNSSLDFYYLRSPGFVGDCFNNPGSLSAARRFIGC
jgi:hypothetical protein